MKKLLILVVLIVFLAMGLWCGATFWYGVKTEERYYALLRQASNIQNLRFENESYSRGFLDSRARTVLVIQPSPGTAAENPPIRITLAHDITHGPFPFHKSVEGVRQFKPLAAIIETRVVFSPETRDHLAELYAQIPELEATRDTTLIFLDGNGLERFVIPAFRRTLGGEDPLTLDWNGLSLQLNFTSEFKRLSGSLSIPAMEILGKDLSLKIQGVQSSFNSEEGIQGLSLGEASFSLGALEFTERDAAGSSFFQLGGFNITTSAKASGDLVNLRLNVRSDEVRVDEIQARSSVFDLEFRNLDAASLAKMARTLDEPETQPAPGPLEPAQDKILVRYLELLPGLLKKSPEIELRQLDIQTSDGNFTARAKITYDGAKSASAPYLYLPALVNGVSAQAEILAGERLVRRVAAAFLEDAILAQIQEENVEDLDEEEIHDLVSTRIDDRLNALTARNFLVEQDGSYRATASYNAGEILWNGRPLQVRELLE